MSYKTPFEKALRGKSRQAIADAVGVDVSYLSHLLADRKRPSLDVAHRLAAVLGTTVDALFPPKRTKRAA